MSNVFNVYLLFLLKGPPIIVFSFRQEIDIWIGSGKMVVVLDDAAVLEMLSLKQANGKVEETIRSKIADFRMGL